MSYELSNDITRAAQLAWKLKASQAALRKSERDMEVAANAVDLALWTWDIPSDEVRISHKARAVFGFSPSEKLDAERIRYVIHPEDRDMVRKAVKNALETRSEEHTSELQSRRDLVCRLPPSSPLFPYTTLFRSVAANAVDLALWTWDIPSDEVRISHKARAVFGFSPSEKLDAERIRNVIHPEDRDTVRKAVKNALET